MCSDERRAAPQHQCYKRGLASLSKSSSRSFLDLLLKTLISGNAAETAAPALSAMLVYILMATVLFFRPQGLFVPRSG